MANPTKITRGTLLTGGILVSCIGVGHIFMPAFGYNQQIPLAMGPAVSDHFYYLGTYAICSFLLTLGFISVYVSQLKQANIIIVINTLFAGLWVGRAILEIIYPVRLKLFFLTNPTTVLLPVISLIAANYTISSIAYLLSKK